MCPLLQPPPAEETARRAAIPSAQRSEEVPLQALVTKEIGENTGTAAPAATGKEICCSSGTASSTTEQKETDACSACRQGR